MSDSWRTFVAIPIGDELRHALASAVEGWRSRPELEGLRWTEPAGWHVTLAFLGATDASRIGALVEGLDRCAAAHSATTLRTGGVGAFPSRGRAGVVWYGIADPERALGSLAASVCSTLGVDPDKRFRPHVTLARARREPMDLRAWVEDAVAPAGDLRVDGIQLMRSHLGRGPARYETLASLPLGAALHV